MKQLKNFTLALLLGVGITNIAFSQDAPGISPSVRDFNSIALGGPFNVVVKMGNEESVRVEATSEDVKDIIVEVKDHTLRLKLKNSYQTWKKNYQKINIFVTAKQLKNITVGGSGSLKVENEIKSDDIELTVSGSGSIQISVNTSSIESTVSGSGSIQIAGTSDQSDITVSGSGTFKGQQLKTSKASVVISGSGSASIHTDEELNATISGSGSVIYSGSPTNVNTHTSGSGKVRKAE
ncbi:head GIN domain-containing protein [Solitalea lacus]|uniref:head GIN domain-containing protein n=1 Tax=Solitalea lacus TaxID=2911172 RepID=UPI001ED9D73C|nr:head GIN domain-containing protein [Solitalea lacus]UKJ08658.1 DUF2807 domain-containing protein [Solitalea lacus]